VAAAQPQTAMEQDSESAAEETCGQPRERRELPTIANTAPPGIYRETDAVEPPRRSGENWGLPSANRRSHHERDQGN